MSGTRFNVSQNRLTEVEKQDNERCAKQFAKDYFKDKKKDLEKEKLLVELFLAFAEREQLLLKNIQANEAQSQQDVWDKDNKEYKDRVFLFSVDEATSPILQLFSLVSKLPVGKRSEIKDTLVLDSETNKSANFYRCLEDHGIKNHEKITALILRQLKDQYRPPALFPIEKLKVQGFLDPNDFLDSEDVKSALDKRIGSFTKPPVTVMVEDLYLFLDPNVSENKESYDAHQRRMAEYIRIERENAKTEGKPRYILMPFNNGDNHFAFIKIQIDPDGTVTVAMKDSMEKHPELRHDEKNKMIVKNINKIAGNPDSDERDKNAITYTGNQGRAPATCSFYAMREVADAMDHPETLPIQNSPGKVAENKTEKDIGPFQVEMTKKIARKKYSSPKDKAWIDTLTVDEDGIVHTQPGTKLYQQKKDAMKKTGASPDYDEKGESKSPTTTVVSPATLPPSALILPPGLPPQHVASSDAPSARVSASGGAASPPSPPDVTFEPPAVSTNFSLNASSTASRTAGIAAASPQPNPQPQPKSAVSTAPDLSSTTSTTRTAVGPTPSVAIVNPKQSPASAIDPASSASRVGPEPTPPHPTSFSTVSSSAGIAAFVPPRPAAALREAGPAAPTSTVSPVLPGASAASSTLRVEPEPVMHPTSASAATAAPAAALDDATSLLRKIMDDEKRLGEGLFGAHAAVEEEHPANLADDAFIRVYIDRIEHLDTFVTSKEPGEAKTLAALMGEADKIFTKIQSEDFVQGFNVREQLFATEEIVANYIRKNGSKAKLTYPYFQKDYNTIYLDNISNFVKSVRAQIEEQKATLPPADLAKYEKSLSDIELRVQQARDHQNRVRDFSHGMPHNIVAAALIKQSEVKGVEAAVAQEMKTVAASLQKKPSLSISEATRLLQELSAKHKVDTTYYLNYLFHRKAKNIWKEIEKIQHEIDTKPYNEDRNLLMLNLRVANNLLYAAQDIKDPDIKQKMISFADKLSQTPPVLVEQKEIQDFFYNQINRQYYPDYKTIMPSYLDALWNDIRRSYGELKAELSGETKPPALADKMVEYLTARMMFCEAEGIFNESKDDTSENALFFVQQQQRKLQALSQTIQLINSNRMSNSQVLSQLSHLKIELEGIESNRAARGVRSLVPDLGEAINLFPRDFAAKEEKKSAATAPPTAPAAAPALTKAAACKQMSDRIGQIHDAEAKLRDNKTGCSERLNDSETGVSAEKKLIRPYRAAILNGPYINPTLFELKDKEPEFKDIVNKIAEISDYVDSRTFKKVFEYRKFIFEMEQSVVRDYIEDNSISISGPEREKFFPTIDYNMSYLDHLRDLLADAKQLRVAYEAEPSEDRNILDASIKKLENRINLIQQDINASLPAKFNFGVLHKKIAYELCKESDAIKDKAEKKKLLEIVDKLTGEPLLSVNHIINELGALKPNLHTIEFYDRLDMVFLKKIENIENLLGQLKSKINPRRYDKDLQQKILNLKIAHHLFLNLHQEQDPKKRHQIIVLANELSQYPPIIQPNEIRDRLSNLETKKIDFRPIKNAMAEYSSVYQFEATKGNIPSCDEAPKLADEMKQYLKNLEALWQSEFASQDAALASLHVDRLKLVSDAIRAIDAFKESDLRVTDVVMDLKRQLESLADKADADLVELKVEGVSDDECQRYSDTMKKQIENIGSLIELFPQQDLVEKHEESVVARPPESKFTPKTPNQYVASVKKYIEEDQKVIGEEMRKSFETFNEMKEKFNASVPRDYSLLDDIGTIDYEIQVRQYLLTMKESWRASELEHSTSSEHPHVVARHALIKAALESKPITSETLTAFTDGLAELTRPATGLRGRVGEYFSKGATEDTLYEETNKCVDFVRRINGSYVKPITDAKAHKEEVEALFVEDKKAEDKEREEVEYKRLYVEGKDDKSVIGTKGILDSFMKAMPLESRYFLEKNVYEYKNFPEIKDNKPVPIRLPGDWTIKGGAADTKESKNPILRVKVPVCDGLPSDHSFDYKEAKTQAVIRETNRGGFVEVSIEADPKGYSELKSDAEKLAADIALVEAAIRIWVTRFGNSQEAQICIPDLENESRMRAMIIVCKAHNLKFLLPSESFYGYDFVPDHDKPSINTKAGELAAEIEAAERSNPDSDRRIRVKGISRADAAELESQIDALEAHYHDEIEGKVTTEEEKDRYKAEIKSIKELVVEAKAGKIEAKKINEAIKNLHEHEREIEVKPAVRGGMRR